MKKIILLLALSLPFYAMSDDFVELKWQELAAKNNDIDVSLPELTDQQKLALKQILILQNDASKQAEEQRLQLAEQLKIEGVDADEAIAARQAYMTAKQNNAEAITQEYDGKKIRMPGFIVPIEFDGLKTTEFLLVPVAGACIHMPPPPANQIVRVSYPEGFTVQNVQYPVWIEGDFHSKKVTEEVFLVDGKSNITMGYEMNASLIEDYYEPES
ncbi:DUF3299 domain-containing protein [Aliivibrio finisterrensis]|uniref:DUF3299 domain-containing protein n=1 Tax=Aliivibrio finisterrensis TaxID=511998 RepID=A0A4Q5KP45_9GAMM|nr:MULTISPECIES: DUF3299 domain-containing protein [Aliivibrio]MDD9173458.1 DUF3299 domain-containing protein [Aliivibrio sp. S3TY1]MDD9190534.1 DUF3299 domain-containing protein [Aliivibrio sp. S2TY2]RYU47335.1 DUF3299 domain-containing protein [Aliivibrio finisterrensis]